MSKVIYKITPNVNHYRVIFPDSESLCEPDLWKPDGSSKESTLINFSAHYNQEKKTPIGDITAINLQGLAIKEHVANELADIFEDSGELLPFYVGDENWYFYNVTRTIRGFLDVEMSTFMLPGLNIGLQKAVFKKEKLPKHSCIFKIPEDRFEGTYVLDSRVSDRDISLNLFCALQAHGFTGLSFEEVARFE
ncbi:MULTISPECIES: hypothetical protein [Pseudoalteromonas]|uniref:hypothetical protein n=2 Tax=Pseudoalteromonas TaxID=53246 RepID=UPI000BBC991F|nr:MULTISPECIES: hypothetical protein [Pseudoalteromonas]MCK8118999.1 hypothetical protein [Pseudoalteromonas sp. 2CM37A]MCQ8821843.1 hypothetical protein [Pseudoalteromonas agarivorans]MCW1720458.1 hypothetical protein [Pseudoalteromonas sp. A3]MDC9510498.1 hypothetical protein [Pseudoalteromonas sp. Angola-4]MDC9526972.1 hypothetical protein [Pseudoalteromonas sp. Angola-30]|tara:strand:- start:2167 stop:2742 length:576 start_codon:yes stop_codon:yes gene_type:complete